jgi:hypothetical protein
MSNVLEILLLQINLVQALGFLAFFVSLYAFSRTSDKQLRIGQAVQSFVLALHFYLLGANTAASMSLLTVARNFLSLHKKVKNLAILFIVIYVAVGIYTYRELVDILPILSTLLGTTAVFYFSGIKMRLTMMLSTTLWIVHNAVFISIGPLLMELFIFSVTARTVYKLWKSNEI